MAMMSRMLFYFWLAFITYLFCFIYLYLFYPIIVCSIIFLFAYLSLWCRWDSVHPSPAAHPLVPPPYPPPQAQGRLEACHMAIHSGPLVCGIGGTAMRKTQVLFGATVQLAQRLVVLTEALEAPILLTQTVYEVVGWPCHQLTPQDGILRWSARWSNPLPPSGRLARPFR